MIQSIILGKSYNTKAGCLTALRIHLNKLEVLINEQQTLYEGDSIQKHRKDTIKEIATIREVII